MAARGELLAKIGTRHAGEPFRLCAETHCQVYAGASRETPRTTAAVEATRGEVLFDGSGAAMARTWWTPATPPAAAVTPSTTRTSGRTWAPHPTLRGHRDSAAGAGDPFAAGRHRGPVERFLDRTAGRVLRQVRASRAAPIASAGRSPAAPAELDRLLASHKLGPVKAIEVLERGVSGRARQVRIVGAPGSELVQGELRIRQTFGGLRSSLFVVKVEGGAATFRGGGFGHGVGLCQTGSIGMAEAGKSYRDILRHYYQGSVVRKLW